MPYSLTPRQEETIKSMLVLALPHSKIASAANCAQHVKFVESRPIYSNMALFMLQKLCVKVINVK